MHQRMCLRLQNQFFPGFEALGQSWLAVLLHAAAEHKQQQAAASSTAA
jgi:hypothetical protein